VFLRELSLIGTFFVLTVTISNLAYRLFGFTLIPVVKVSFEAFHAWCHWILHVLVFSWLTALLGWLWYCVVWLCSWLFPVIPWRLQIRVPSIVSDFALVSLALTRVFQSADLIVPREVRAQAESQMTRERWAEIEKVEGVLWGPIHRFLDRINAKIWAYIDAIQSFVTLPIRSHKNFGIMVRRLLISLAGAVLFWGFIRLAGYTINVLVAGRLSSPIMIVRKRFFKYFGLNLAGALVATAVFILLNAWLAEWLEPNLPTAP
jgi:hypothetical protein